MKILFYIERFEFNSATARCGELMADELAKCNQVDILCFKDETIKIPTRQRLEIKERNNHLHRIYNYYFPYIQYAKYVKESCEWDNVSKCKRAFQLIKHPLAIRGFLDIRRRKDEANETRISILEKLCEENNYDAVIAMVYPYQTGIILSMANINTKKIMYQLDPYSFCYMRDDRNEIREEEYHVIEKMDAVISTALIKRDFKQDKDFEVFDKKVFGLHYPNIKRPQVSDPSLTGFDPSSINLVFAGNLWEKIRNPKYILKLISRLDDNVVFHIYGSGCESIIGEYKAQLGKRLVVHGFVSQEIAAAALQQADILVNLNNDLPNQLASKTFDYISCGRPILNVCCYKPDNSEEYISRYPIHMNIYQNEGISDELVEQVNDFIANNRGKEISWDTIQKNYGDCTVENVGKEFNNIVFAVVNS